MIRQQILACAILTAICLVTTGLSLAEEAKIVSVRKIWDAAPHNAFTDLIRFKDQWFCVFREGKGHVSPDGSLRVLTSSDGQQWKSAALMRSPTGDLRDAKITLTPDGRLMLSGAEALHPPADAKHQSLAWFSEDGRNWSPPVRRARLLALARHLARQDGLWGRLRHGRHAANSLVSQRRRPRLCDLGSHAA
jgi:hypothetical protein